mmetsp:Transcript_28769/g.80325  ORF Transcript_28769/g.80325 Transcript_28769/m.80325 type:complete len:82 (-) Transcript_28769:215-460(-)
MQSNDDVFESKLNARSRGSVRNVPTEPLSTGAMPVDTIMSRSRPPAEALVAAVPEGLHLAEEAYMQTARFRALLRVFGAVK